MPKVDIDYSNTIFYKISCKNHEISDVYIGHTTNFVQRKYAHKQACLNKGANQQCKLYKVMRENDGWDNWNMEIIAFHACDDHYSARKQEQKYFEEFNATLNSIEPFPKPKIKPEPKPEKIIRKCDTCNITFFTINQQETHNKTNKHIKNLKMINDNRETLEMIMVNPIKPQKKYYCKPCNFNSSNKKDYERHHMTAKHKMIQENTINEQKPPLIYICRNCKKSYKYNSGLSRHKQTCKSQINEEDSTQEIQNTNENNIDYKDMFLEMMKENRELHNTIKEIMKNVLKEVTIDKK